MIARPNAAAASFNLGWTRPPKDSWVAPEEEAAFDFTTSTLRSAEDLLRNPGTIPPEGREMVYYFQRDCGMTRPKALKPYLMFVARETGMHVLGMGALLLGGLAIGGLMGMQAGSELPIIGGLLLAGSAGMGLYAGHNNYPLRREDYAHYGERIRGKLVDASGADGSRHLTFYPYGQQDHFVRLARHAGAEVVPGGEPDYWFPTEGQAWWSKADPVIKKKGFLDA
ncbi:MAG: hypothetical protein AMXMBFR33_71150 [Candidatus Xenobia bacterium]